MSYKGGKCGCEYTDDVYEESLSGWDKGCQLLVKHDFNLSDNTHGGLDLKEKAEQIQGVQSHYSASGGSSNICCHIDYSLRDCGDVGFDIYEHLS